MTTLFISGHRDLTRAEFDLHYLPRLHQAVEQGCSFVVGDAPGCDSLAQAYLRARGVSSVIVYYRGRWPRNNIGGWPTRGGFAWHEHKDAAMTRASDSDLLWVRPGREDSGTARNQTRRLAQVKAQQERGS